MIYHMAFITHNQNRLTVIDLYAITITILYRIDEEMQISSSGIWINRIHALHLHSVSLMPW